MPNNGKSNLNATVWQILVTKSGQMSALSIPDEVWTNARRFIESTASGKKNGLFGSDASEAGKNPYGLHNTTTAMGMVGLILMKDNPGDDRFKEGAKHLRKNIPKWKKKNFLHWYFGTLALHFIGGKEKTEWYSALKTTLIQQQDQNGSWSAKNDKFLSETGGNSITATCLGVISLSSNY